MEGFHQAGLMVGLVGGCLMLPVLWFLGKRPFSEAWLSAFIFTGLSSIIAAGVFWLLFVIGAILGNIHSGIEAFLTNELVNYFTAVLAVGSIFRVWIGMAREDIEAKRKGLSG